jgi:integrase/recombinase XerD
MEHSQRSWLGHVSIDTTNIYAELDLEMKATALAKWPNARLTIRENQPSAGAIGHA